MNNLAGLTGTTTYEGPTNGNLTPREIAADEHFYYFNAKAIIEANFGDANEPGEASPEQSPGGRTDESVALPDLMLGSAGLTATSAV